MKNSSFGFVNLRFALSYVMKATSLSRGENPVAISRAANTYLMYPGDAAARDMKMPRRQGAKDWDRNRNSAQICSSAPNLLNPLSHPVRLECARGRMGIAKVPGTCCGKSFADTIGIGVKTQPKTKHISLCT